MPLTHFPHEADATPPTVAEVADALALAGFDPDTMAVDVSGATVRLSGRMSDMAMREAAVLAAGRISGVATVDDDLQVPPDASADPQARDEPADLHTVHAGETFASIAALHYGDPALASTIVAANVSLVPAGWGPEPGTVLRVPRR